MSQQSTANYDPGLERPNGWEQRAQPAIPISSWPSETEGADKNLFLYFFFSYLNVAWTFIYENVEKIQVHVPDRSGPGSWAGSAGLASRLVPAPGSSRSAVSAGPLSKNPEEGACQSFPALKQQKELPGAQIF